MPERFGVGKTEAGELVSRAGRLQAGIGLSVSITEVIWQWAGTTLGWAVVPPAVRTCKRPLC